MLFSFFLFSDEPSMSCYDFFFMLNKLIVSYFVYDNFLLNNFFFSELMCVFCFISV